MSRFRSRPALIACSLLAGLVGAVLIGPPAGAIATRTPAPSSWAQLSSGPSLSISARPSLLRWPNGQVQVAWTEPEMSGGGGNASIRTRTRSPAGVWGPTVTVADSWSSIGTAPKIVAGAAEGRLPERVVVFDGNRTDVTTDPYTNGIFDARSTDGRAWALAPNSLSATNGAGPYDLAAAYTGKELAAAWTNSASLFVHIGGESGIPSTAPDVVVAPAGNGTNIASDRAGGMWQVWSDGSTGDVRVRQVAPALGPVATAPGSAYTTSPGQNLPLVVRPDGSVWTAYARPGAPGIRVWRVGSRSPITIPTPAPAQAIGLSAYRGALWLSWHDNGGPGRVRALRTNQTVTRLGAQVSVPAPGPGYRARTASGDGSGGPLDLAVIAGDLPRTQVFVTHLLPGLSVTAAPSALSARRGGRSLISVTDAGAPVGYASVRVGGVVLRTDRTGRAWFVSPKGARAGGSRVVATRTGYTPAAAVLAVR